MKRFNRINKKIISIILSIAIIFSTMVFANTIQAATPVSYEKLTFDVWADPNNVMDQSDVTDFANNKLSTLGGIKPFKNSTYNSAVYYLFLPANTDCNNLVFWFDGTLTIDGKTVVSGVPTNALASIDAGAVTKRCTFVINGRSHTVTCMKSGDVGSVFVDTVSGSMNSIYSSSNHSVGEAGSVMVVQPDGSVDYMGDLEKIQGRGNATWSTSNDKNPFNIKLAASTSLLGMGKAKKWCLLANVADSSLVKNQITYDFSKYIGVKYQPTCKPVDLFINQQYYGSYQLSERVEIKSNRIEVNNAYDNLEIANSTVDPVTGIIMPVDLSGTPVNSVSSSGAYSIGSKKYSSSLNDPADVTGGYLYELEISERWIEENAGFCGYNKQCWVLKNCDYASAGMINYSYDLLFALGSSVYNGGIVPNKPTLKTYSRGNSDNPAPAEKYQGKKWSDLLDSDSAVRYYIVEELFKNLDASTTSCYFYKDSDAIDSKLYAGPVWDMDKCWGNTDYRWGSSVGSSDGWYAKNVRIYKYNSNTEIISTDSNDSQRPLAFLGQLCTQPEFWNDVEKCWQNEVSPAIDILTGKSVDESGVLKSINEYVSTIDKSATMNATRFSVTGNGNYSTSSNVETLSNWVSSRQTWIDKQITHYNIADVSIKAIDNQTYTSEKIEPKLEITHVKNGVNTVLEDGVDYTVEYSDNVNAGIASATITGRGIYSGTVTKTFVINPVDLSENSTVSISKASKVGSTLTATVKNANNEIKGGISYQWYRNDTPIENETAVDYQVVDSDLDSEISVEVTGDNQNVIGSLFSNACTIVDDSSVGGFTKTISSWKYNYTVDSSALADYSIDDDVYSYIATEGENKDSSFLTASVNTKETAKIKWSGTDLYVNGEITDQAPIIGTSKTDLVAWGEYPYFDVNISTLGYENIAVSAKLGGSKRAPRSWKVQYSTDSVTFVDVPQAQVVINDNKILLPAFDNVVLPAECDNIENLTIRFVAFEDMAISGVNTIIGVTSGDMAINDIVVTGSSTSIITSLEAPSFSYENGSKLYDDQLVAITDNNGGADVYYSINDSEPVLYESPISIFDVKTASYNDSVVVKAWSSFGNISSNISEVNYIFNGVDLANFSYDDYCTSTVNGAVPSVAGVYQSSGRMTAYADTRTEFVPLWRTNANSFCVAPDDGAKWSQASGFTYKISTAGYENILFSADAMTTASGPNSVVLQYSLDGKNYKDVTNNVKLETVEFSKAFDLIMLPAECNNRAELYVRLATKQNLTNSGEALFNNLSKGNLYVNNVIIAGEDSNDYKMPFTNKSTDYFGANGTIDYVSPDGNPIKYAVFDSDKTPLQSGVMENNSIKLADVQGFNPKNSAPYTIMAWTGEDEDSSQVNVRHFYYKGTTIAKFDYNLKSRLLENYLDSTSTIASSTSGVVPSTLTMKPNANQSAVLSYSDTYGVKISWTQEDPFVATKQLDNPAGNGYWLIETSTENYCGLSLSLKQISSNKGPRDWGIAYSVDGEKFNYVPNSNVRAISNDASTSVVDTYSNFALPSACDNQEKLYIKVFINGGESVDGAELETLLKGNTGMNSIELCGVEIPSMHTLTINTVSKSSPTDDNGGFAVDAQVKINNEVYNTVNGIISVDLFEGKNNHIEVSMNGKTFVEKRSIVLNGDTTLDVAIVALDYVADGCINAKDFAFINREIKGDMKSNLLSIYKNFVNFKEI